MWKGEIGMLPKNKFIALLVVSLFFSALLFGQQRATILQTIVLEDFELSDDGSPKRYWTAIPDRFGRKGSVASGESMQELMWVKAWPEAYFGTEKANAGRGEFFYGPSKSEGNLVRYTDVSKTSLAIKLAYNRQGYRVTELFPLEKSADGKFKKTPIPFRGKVRQVDFWVWGSNFDYFMEMVLIDYRGVEHRLEVGNIRHVGWKNFVVQMPNNIPQDVTTIPSNRPLSLVKYAIWSNPKERVSGATFYIDHIKYLADVYEELYDGYQLGDPEYVKNIKEKAAAQPKESDILQ
ncbi:MAG TPA: hypothetical protein DDY71_14990 [Spirochaetia bacterium]|nr:hypothetical protein [Spirochaetia bacterium]HBI38945.1 hypothetical protein [Spirochaetia bacterium]